MKISFNVNRLKFAFNFKILIYAFVLSIIGTQAYAQPAVFNWAESFGNFNDDKGNGIKVDGSGNIYTIGNFNDSVDFDPGNGVFKLYGTGYTDIYVAKYDPSGNLLWAKQFGGTVHDNGTSIAIDDLGNVYTTGSFANTADFDPGTGVYNLTSAGGLDVFVSKLDASGNFVWAKQMGGSLVSSIGGDEGKAIALDPAGNIYVSGRFEYTGDFDPGPGQFILAAAGTECDIFLTKLDASGNFVWAKKWGATGNGDWVNAIVVDDSANVYTSGSFYSNIDFDPGTGNFSMAPGGLAGIYISKLDSSGNFVWAKQFSKQGGFLQDLGSIATDKLGNIYAAGAFSGSVDFNPGTGTNILTAGSGSNSFVVKLSSVGNYIWAKSFGGSGEVTAIGLTTDIYNNVYTTGWFNDNNPNCDFDPGTGIYKLTAAGYLDVFISKLDASGNFVWAKGMGGVAEDVGNALAIDGAANVYSTGYFSGTADFNPDTATVFNLVAVASADIFLHKMNQLGAGITEWNPGMHLDVFPNPSAGSFTVLLPEAINQSHVKIIDVFGNLIYYQKQFTGDKFNFNNRSMKPGVYLIELKSETTAYTSKIIIQ